MTTKDLNQRLFEAMGYKITLCPPSMGKNLFWWTKNGKPLVDKSFALKEYAADYLPNACDSWEVCRKYVIPFMRGKGFGYEVSHYNKRLGFFFRWYGQVENNTLPRRVKVKIINDNLPMALVEATFKVLEAK